MAKNGSQLKKGKIVVRIKGCNTPSTFEAILKHAKKVADELDRGIYKGNKVETIGIV